MFDCTCNTQKFFVIEPTQRRWLTSRSKRGIFRHMLPELTDLAWKSVQQFSGGPRATHGDADKHSSACSEEPSRPVTGTAGGRNPVGGSSSHSAVLVISPRGAANTCLVFTTETSVFLDALWKPEVASLREWRQMQTSAEAHKYSNEINEARKYSLPVDLASCFNLISST